MDAKEAREDSGESYESAVTDGPQYAEESAEYPRRASRPKYRRWRDMSWSLLVLMLPIALFFGAWKVFFGGPQAREIDPSEYYSTAENAGLDVFGPLDLPDGWKVVGGGVSHGDEEGAVTLRIGYLAADDGGFQVMQTTDESAVEDAVSGDGDSITEAGMDWTEYDSGGSQVWVSDGPGGSTLVVTADEDGVPDWPALAEAIQTAL
ncbi:DUF4245 family protein [Haloglycomyces albus]|uniref:DUF4245 family protein n=1 Tax=Haloglycomyces albus TaxID=526067 RepID=UPI00046CCCA1|nr:DUF4245 family protein [Haloglycomyces albus]